MWCWPLRYPADHYFRLGRAGTRGSAPVRVPGRSRRAAGGRRFPGRASPGRP